MRRKLFSIWSILLVLVVSIGVLGLGCPTTGGTIEVEATFDGSPWSGPLDYTLTPDTGSPITGASVPGSHSADAGNWTCSYDSGGPSGDLVSITHAPNQELSDGGTITFTLNFVTPQPVDAWIEFETWTVNGTPVGPNPGTIFIGPNTIVDARYKEGVNGTSNQTCQTVTVKETLQKTHHNNGNNGEPGPDRNVHVVNAPGAVWGVPPFEGIKSQKATVGGVEQDPCTNFVLSFCEEITLDVEIETVQHINTVYTKNVNWVRYYTTGGGADKLQNESLFDEDVSLVLPGQQIQIMTWASVELDEPGYYDSDPSNDTCMPSGLVAVVYLPGP